MWKALRYFVVVYGILCMAFHALQDYLFFQAKPLAPNQSFDFAGKPNFQSISIPLDENTTIEIARFLPKTDTPKGIVLFFHGNKQNIAHYQRYVPMFTNKGYEVLIPDYPGYGHSTGKISTETMHELASQTYALARKQFTPQQITIYGKSLGTGIATRLASERDCKQLVLETPYKSLAAVAKQYLFFLPIDWLVKYNLSNAECIGQVRAPITLIHGDRDALLSLTQAAALVPLIKKSDVFYMIKGGSHNDLPDFPVFTATLDSLMQH